jgi:hypothetical protein
MGRDFVMYVIMGIAFRLLTAASSITALFNARPLARQAAIPAGQRPPIL